MAVSLAKQASSSTSATPPEIRADPTIDLRVADATWQHRQLQARVQRARRRLYELESRPRRGGTTLETHLGNAIVEAQNQIIRERSDARRAAAALMAEAELESRRRVEVARAEARALLAVAEWLRSQGRRPWAGDGVSVPGHDRGVAAGTVDTGVVRG